MSKEELRKGTREMVKYLLDEEVKDDNDIIDGYTNTFMMGFEEYIKNLETNTQEKSNLLVRAYHLLQFCVGTSSTIDITINDWVNEYEKHITKQR